MPASQLATKTCMPGHQGSWVTNLNLQETGRGDRRALPCMKHSRQSVVLGPDGSLALSSTSCTSAQVCCRTSVLLHCFDHCLRPWALPQSSGTFGLPAGLGDTKKPHRQGAVSPEAIVPKGRNKTYRGVRQRCADRPIAGRLAPATDRRPQCSPGLHMQAVGQVGSGDQRPWRRHSKVRQ